MRAWLGRLRRGLTSRADVLEFDGTLDLSRLAVSPLEELRRRSEARGFCDDAGRRIKGAPWGMQLAHPDHSNAWPVVRTIGFQSVNADGLTFLLRRRNSAGGRHRLPVSMVYVEGRYCSGEICEQWRCEGEAFEIGVEDAMQTAPLASFAQMIAAAAVPTHESRSSIRDRDNFLKNVDQVKTRLLRHEKSPDEIALSVVLYKLQPIRAEVLIGGPDFGACERIEWRRKTRGDPSSSWSLPQRILPY